MHLSPVFEKIMDGIFWLWEYIRIKYEDLVFRTGDPRLKDWFLVKSPVPTIIITLAYLAMCYLGPKVMAKRKPLELTSILVAYNFMMVGISLCIFLELLIPAIHLGYNFICDPLEYSTSPTHMRLANGIWIFYISKMLEFTDTAFFIIRKKNNQITFLHVYHHATMFSIWWTGVKWYAGGVSFFAPMINGFVHVVMYSYYGLSVFPSLRKYLWWKKYLTILQLIQFAVIIMVSSYNIIFGCEYDKWVNWALVTYISSLFFLFLNFYLKAYMVNRSREKNVDSSSCGVKYESNALSYYYQGSPCDLRMRTTSNTSS